MRHAILIALVLAVFTAIAPAQVEKAKTPKQAGGEQDVIKLNKDMFDAIVRKDTAMMDKYETADHVFVNPGGGIEARGTGTREAAAFESMETDEVKVKMHGDTAILTGRAMIKGKLANGRDISGNYRYMRVFIKQDGQWRAAATSAVPIQEQSPTAMQPKSN